MIDLLVSSRLVTSDAGVVEIAHEALARAWPRLRAWLDDDVEGQRILHHLSGAADAWDSMGRPDSELYRGVRLSQALQWRATTDTSLTDTEVDFLEAAEQNDRNERRAAEVRARAQARMIRRLRGVLAGAAALLLVAAGRRCARRYARQTVRTPARDRAGLQTTTRSPPMRVASARRRWPPTTSACPCCSPSPGPRLDDSARDPIEPAGRARRSDPQLIRSTSYDGDKIVGLEVSPDGQTVAVYDLSGQVTLYDATTMEVLHTLPGGDLSPYKWFAPMAFSPDGATLAVGMPPLVAHADHAAGRPHPGSAPGAARRSADERRAGRGHHLQRRRDLDGRRHPAPRARRTASGTSWVRICRCGDLTRGRDHRASACSRTSVCDGGFGFRCMVALSPSGDSSTPARHCARTTSRARRVSTLLRPTSTPAGALRRSNFFDLSPDGSLLAMGEEPDRLLLVDASSGKVRRVLRGHDEEVLAVRFSTDGTRLARRRPTGPRSSGASRPARSSNACDLGDGDSQALAFSPDDSTLYSEDRIGPSASGTSRAVGASSRWCPHLTTTC